LTKTNEGRTGKDRKGGAQSPERGQKKRGKGGKRRKTQLKQRKGGALKVGGGGTRELGRKGMTQHFFLPHCAEIKQGKGK